MYERTLQRFIREGRTLARLDHPNVVRVTNLFRERGTAYPVMGLISGHTLRQELDAARAGRGLEEARVRQVVEQVVAALEAVHAAGVYHLDLKPETLLVREPNGHVLLVDSGAARHGLWQALTLRSQSVQPYTESYAPPEVLAGRAVGPESNLFELAMILHELLTGWCPTSACERLLDPDWAPDATLTPAWRGLLTPALALRRADRPSSVREWWNAAPAGPWVSARSLLEARTDSCACGA